MRSNFVSQEYQDIYFSSDDPEAEKQFVFVEANRIGERIRQSEIFTVAELGFGFGLNYALTLKAAKQVDCLHKLRYFSVDEKFPERAAIEELQSRLTHCSEEYYELWNNAAPAGAAIFQTDVLAFLRQLAPVFSPPATGIDAWYFDGFSPVKNPTMWSAEVFARAYTLTKPGGSFATYTAAGWVKRNLGAAGFVVHKVPGFGMKRDMLVGHKPVDVR
ncbi:MAG: tRNA (5-methylaminomethyl-2-thiouridine)(34)-methyltransferase MnmD [Spirochaetes bacterium]|nr:tRNA (5-methylaminomethyl-2-thiouridine)(34)-methyltransferase MnmD [Spirochaetota bacterium]